MFSHSHIDGHLGCFYISAFVNGAAIDLCVQVVGSVGGTSVQWHTGLRTSDYGGRLLASVESVVGDQIKMTLDMQSVQEKEKTPLYWPRGFFIRGLPREGFFLCQTVWLSRQLLWYS